MVKLNITEEEIKEVIFMAMITCAEKNLADFKTAFNVMKNNIQIFGIWELNRLVTKYHLIFKLYGNAMQPNHRRMVEDVIEYLEGEIKRTEEGKGYE